MVSMALLFNIILTHLSKAGADLQSVPDERFQIMQERHGLQPSKGTDYKSAPAV